MTLRCTGRHLSFVSARSSGCSGGVAGERHRWAAERDVRSLPKGLRKMWAVSLISALLLTLFPLGWFLTWRAGKALTGMRSESHQSQADRFYRLTAPIWLLMLLLMGQQIIDAHPGSREHRAFWFGFIIASDLFLLAFIIYNLVLQMRQTREKRKQQAQAAREVLDSQPDAGLSKVRALLIAGLRIRAVQLHREQTGGSIEASLAAIEQMESHVRFADSA